jgi:hypothetical protein
MQRRCRQTHAAECSSGFPNLLSVCPWPQISLGFLAVWSWKNLRCAASCLTIDMGGEFESCGAHDRGRRAGDRSTFPVGALPTHKCTRQSRTVIDAGTFPMYCRTKLLHVKTKSQIFPHSCRLGAGFAATAVTGTFRPGDAFRQESGTGVSRPRARRPSLNGFFLDTL